MIRKIAVLIFLIGSACFLKAQNVFDPADTIIRYDVSQPLGSPQHPDPNVPGLQKWVSTPTIGVSYGNDAFDASSFKQYFINVGTGKLAFRLKYPKSYNNPDSANKKYPVMLFLHGGGEVGCPSNGGIYNNEKPLWLGGSLFMQFVDQNKFDGFLLYPQLVVTEGCFAGWAQAHWGNYDAILNMIDSMVVHTRADVDRLVVTGLSGGGYGAWRMADGYPKRVAKIIPSASVGATTTRENFVHIPIWFATGGLDPAPDTNVAKRALRDMKQIGADIRYTMYPTRGHSMWYQHWREPDFVPALNDVHKANPLIFFQHGEFCPGELIDAKLGITPGFYAYEWEKDGALIATRLNGVNTILDNGSVISFTGNEINVKAYGVYRVRFKRSASSQWSEWSRKPAVIQTKATTETPPIAIQGARSKTLPALDGSVTVPLMLPPGFLKYEWYDANTDELLDSTQVFNAPVGVYKARYSEEYGCGTTFSPEFTVVNADGTPKPDPANTLVATPLSASSIRLNWKQVANPVSNETGFEVYRGVETGGPYTFVAITNANVTSFTDTGLVADKVYYYVVRAVNATGASAGSNEAPAKTVGDNTPPTAPGNLQYAGSTLSTVSLKWDASTDNIGVDHYDIYVNGEKLFSATGTSFTVTNLDSLTSYAFTVRAVDKAGNISPASAQVVGHTHRQGLNYQYYNGNWTNLPDFNALTPDKTGLMDTVSINSGVKTQDNHYGFLWQGYIYIPVTATYTFETYSDDGSRLYIDEPYSDSATILVDNDGIHGATSKTGTILLSAGYHRIAIAFFQGTGGQEMQLFWSNDAGMSRQRIPRNFFVYENVELAPAPAMPGSLTATGAAYNKITLEWEDNSNDETGFEIVRSATANGTYLPVGAVGANVGSFTDSALAAQTTYFYKIRAIGSGEASAFTGAVSAVTLPAPATPVAPSQLAATASANNSVSLSWNDNASNETNYRVYRSTDNISFELIATLSANVTAYTDASVLPLTLYYYYVAGSNAAGTGEHSNIAQVRAGNNAPVIAEIADIVAMTDETVVRNITITDDPGDSLTVAIVNQPSFVKLQWIDAENYRLTITPSDEHAGSYALTLTASDGNGQSASRQFTLIVSNKSTRSVYVNLGSAGRSAGLPWNNWLGPRNAGQSIANLKDDRNVVTPFSVTMVNGWSGTTDMGHITGDDSGIFPDAVLQSGLKDDGSEAKVILIGGLNPAKQYNIVLAGSQNEGIMAETQYSASGRQSILNARYNTNQAANLNNLIPNANGELQISAARRSGSPVSYLSALVIEEYEPSVRMLSPAHLYAEPEDRASVRLTWSDRTNYENSVDGYELQRATDSLFTADVSAISLPANTTSYRDVDLSPGARYWYRIRTKEGTDYSGYSNRVKAVMPLSIVYVNFNTTVEDAPAPWNNLTTPPMSNFTTPPLKDQSGVSTTMTLTLEEEFNGEFTAGKSTGNNSGVVPDVVLASNYWLDRNQVAQFRLSGLSHNKRYRIGFIGSSGPDGWSKGNYTATYTVNNKTVYLNSWENTSKIVYIDNIAPDEAGKALLSFSTTPSGGYGFNSAIIIQELAWLPDEPSDSIPDPGTPPTDTIPDPPGPGDTDPIGSPPPDSILPADGAIKVKAYPNPFYKALKLKFYNSSPEQKISVAIYDSYGRLMLRKDFGAMPQGDVILELGSLQSKLMRNGIYLVEVKVDGKNLQTIKALRMHR
ncbi:MAG TPA: PA14 domain-containing protein [Flavitalea sp.]|nr:PA14 domain-containing protein [Flavitalea sp.]